MGFLESNDRGADWLDSGFSNAVGSRMMSNSGCEGVCGNINGIFHGGCATCGPNCNCNCVDNKCTEVARTGSRRAQGNFYNQSGIGGGTTVGTGISTLPTSTPSTYPTCTSTLNSCPCSYAGCMEPNAINYDASATCDNGSCIGAIPGCMTVGSTNYNANANVDDGSCIAPVMGCTSLNSTNYNPLANVDDGSCIGIITGCTDPNAANYNSLANTGCGGSAPTSPSTSSFSGYSNFNEQGFGGYEDRTWF
jgi:hypothetical protein|tara:strand:+ start:8175 stop:8924 length:750 start_codon:yes stop_codon:yes gene_type:complete